MKTSFVMFNLFFQNLRYSKRDNGTRKSHNDPNWICVSWYFAHETQLIPKLEDLLNTVNDK